MAIADDGLQTTHPRNIRQQRYENLGVDMDVCVVTRDVDGWIETEDVRSARVFRGFAVVPGRGDEPADHGVGVVVKLVALRKQTEYSSNISRWQREQRPAQ